MLSIGPLPIISVIIPSIQFCRVWVHMCLYILASANHIAKRVSIELWPELDPTFDILKKLHDFPLLSLGASDCRLALHFSSKVRRPFPCQEKVTRDQSNARVNWTNCPNEIRIISRCPWYWGKGYVTYRCAPSWVWVKCITNGSLATHHCTTARALAHTCRCCCIRGIDQSVFTTAEPWTHECCYIA